ncbi:unnamed protein product [Owenia fusiformis]|uniref:Fucosyltransferase n=1 Tax=Owenia fusiformis TaxID=6347 RepID=A0A8J1Y7S1_OWEFU|nr:unnamed protein product [Owenia fusiformis]
MAFPLKWYIICVLMVILVIFEVNIFKICLDNKSILPTIKGKRERFIKQNLKEKLNISELEKEMFMDYLKAKSVMQDSQCKKLYGNSKLIHRSDVTLELNFTSKSPQIFWWGNFFNDPPPIEKNQEALDKNCPQYGCTFTNDLALYNDSEAVIFHLPDLEDMEMPYMAVGQRWILTVWESPISYEIPAIHEIKDRFNWTASYMHHSDINMPYYTYRALKQDEKSKETKLIDFYAGKKKKILWTVSNCLAGSQRKIVVRNLRELGWEIDIYGKCGNQSCSFGSKCEKYLGSNYMFYLAFENSLCVDYITEKPARALKWGTIPIVYGWGNYSTILPHHSYIDTKAFESVEKLSEFMHQVADSRDLYNSFFKWRQNFIQSMSPGLACNICKRLYMDHTVQHYTNIQLWWDVNKLCRVFWEVMGLVEMTNEKTESET